MGGRGGFFLRLLEYVKFKRINPLPTWQDEFKGQVRYNDATDHLAFGTGGAWEDIALMSDASGGAYTDEEAQDAVGSILLDTSSIAWTYTDMAAKGIRVNRYGLGTPILVTGHAPRAGLRAA